ncbi:MAG: hypothetical protein ACI4Q6_10450 [Huintestinicola sp.]
MEKDDMNSELFEMLDNNDFPQHEQIVMTEKTSEPVASEKDECCAAAIRLAVMGIIAGLFIPFIGITFALAGIYVNYAESNHHETAKGCRMNVISIIISLLSWGIALLLRPYVWGN